MPENIPSFTKCADPGDAHKFAWPELLVAFIVGGGITGLVLFLVPYLTDQESPCGATAITIVVGLIALLGQLRRWYYNNRLMCILRDQCVVGSVIGKPCVHCDGDRKIDLLIAPFGYAEVDGELLTEAIQRRAAADPSLPAPPADLMNRDSRFTYLKGVANMPDVGEEKLERIYMELVHNIMFDPVRFPGRQFQSRYYRREPPPVMPQNAYDDCPNDVPDTAGANALFKFDKLKPGGFDILELLCGTILQFESECEEGERIVPFLHCEVEGNRLDASIAIVQAALGFFALTWAIVCLACLHYGGSNRLCTWLGVLAGFLIALLIWFTGKWAFDFDGAEAGEIPVDVPDPSGDGPTTMSDGDVVLIRGYWIKDTEHEEYFEIHPVKAWYLVCRDAAGNPVTSSDPAAVECPFEVTRLIAAESGNLCELAASAEETDVEVVFKVDTGRALAFSGGLLKNDAVF